MISIAVVSGPKELSIPSSIKRARGYTDLLESILAGDLLVVDVERAGCKKEVNAPGGFDLIEFARTLVYSVNSVQLYSAH